MPHGYPNHAAVEGVGAARAEQDGVHPHTCRVAEQRANVFVVPHPLQHRHCAGVADNLVHAQRGGAISSGNKSTMHVKPGDLSKHLSGNLVDRHVIRHLVCIQEGVQFRRESDDAPHGKPGFQHPADHQWPLPDHQPFAAWQVWAAIRAVEVANIIKARVAGVGDEHEHYPTADITGSIAKYTRNRAAISHSNQCTVFARPVATATST